MKAVEPLTHCSLHKIADILETFWSAFSWKNFLYLNSHFTRICSLGPSWHEFILDLGIGLASIWHQAITWASDDSTPLMHHQASQSFWPWQVKLTKLIRRFAAMQLLGYFLVSRVLIQYKDAVLPVRKITLWRKKNILSPLVRWYIYNDSAPRISVVKHSRLPVQLIHLEVTTVKPV